MGQSEVPNDPNMSKEVRTFLDSLRKRFNSITTAGIGAAGTTQTDWISGLIKGPLNQDYRLIEHIPEILTFTSFYAKTASGTVTAALKLNSTAITNGSISVTSTQGSATPTALNVSAVGDALVLTCSSISSPVDLSFRIGFTRTLAN